MPINRPFAGICGTPEDIAFRGKDCKLHNNINIIIKYLCLLNLPDYTTTIKSKLLHSVCARAGSGVSYYISPDGIEIGTGLCDFS